MNILKFILDRTIIHVSRGNKITDSGCKIKQSKVRIKGTDNNVYIGKNTTIRKCEFSIKGRNNTVIIGDQCDFTNTKILIDNVNGVINIGAHTSIAGAMIVSFEPHDIIIGEDCMISYDVEIRNTDSHKIISIETGDRINSGKPILIENHVWLGARSTILKGSNIGTNSIVGTNSVVTGGKMPKNSIIAGQPARVIKNGISWNRESVIPE